VSIREPGLAKGRSDSFGNNKEGDAVSSLRERGPLRRALLRRAQRT